MPQDDHAAAAALVVGRCDEASHGGLHAEDTEVVTAHPLRRHETHFAAVGEVEARSTPGRDGGESRRPVAELFPERIREIAVVVVVVAEELHQLLGVRHREGAQHDGVDERVDRGVEADADRKRRDRDGGEHR